jgi:hypothetical protein
MAATGKPNSLAAWNDGAAKSQSSLWCERPSASRSKRCLSKTSMRPSPQLGPYGI